MAYTAQSIKGRLKYKVDTSEWQWSVEANGTEAGEFAYDIGTESTYSAALTAMETAITNRLA